MSRLSLIGAEVKLPEFCGRILLLLLPDPGGLVHVAERRNLPFEYIGRWAANPHLPNVPLPPGKGNDPLHQELFSGQPRDMNDPPLIGSCPFCTDLSRDGLNN